MASYWFWICWSWTLAVAILVWVSELSWLLWLATSCWFWVLAVETADILAAVLPTYWET